MSGASCTHLFGKIDFSAVLELADLGGDGAAETIDLHLHTLHERGMVRVCVCVRSRVRVRVTVRVRGKVKG